MQSTLAKASEAAQEYGIDLNLLECQLELTVEQRIDDHERALAMLNELQKGFEQIHGESQEPSQNSR